MVLGKTVGTALELTWGIELGGDRFFKSGPLQVIPGMMQTSVLEWLLKCVLEIKRDMVFSVTVGNMLNIA